MSDVLLTNIFFTITAGAVIVFTIFLCVALYYFIRILRNVRDITERIKRGSELLAEDAGAVRAFLQEGVMGIIKASFMSLTGKKSSRSKKKSDEDE